MYFLGVSYSGGVLTHMIDSKIFIQMFFIICTSSKNSFSTLWGQQHGTKQQNGRGVLWDEFLHTSFISQYDSKHF